MNRLGAWNDPGRILADPPEPEEPYCGVYWIITTCLTAIAMGAAFGVLLLLWLPS